LNTKSLKTSKG